MATSPGKGQKIRPSSSPDRVQKLLAQKMERNDENVNNREEKSISFKLTKENQKIKALLESSRPRAYTGLKLEPVKTTATNNNSNKFFMKR